MMPKQSPELPLERTPNTATVPALTMSDRIKMLPWDLAPLGYLAEVVRDHWAVDRSPRDASEWLVMAAAMAAFPEMCHTKESCKCPERDECDECQSQSVVDLTVRQFKDFMHMDQEQRDAFLAAMQQRLTTVRGNPYRAVMPGV